MSLLIVASYVVLAGLIIYLLREVVSARQDSRVEIRDNVLAPEELQKHAVDIARNHPVGKSSKSLHWLTA